MTAIVKYTNSDHVKEIEEHKAHDSWQFLQFWNYSWSNNLNTDFSFHACIAKVIINKTSYISTILDL